MLLNQLHLRIYTAQYLAKKNCICIDINAFLQLFTSACRRSSLHGSILTQNFEVTAKQCNAFVYRQSL